MNLGLRRSIRLPIAVNDTQCRHTTRTSKRVLRYGAVIDTNRVVAISQPRRVASMERSYESTWIGSGQGGPVMAGIIRRIQKHYEWDALAEPVRRGYDPPPEAR